MRTSNTKLTAEIILHQSLNQQQGELLKILKDKEEKKKKTRADFHPTCPPLPNSPGCARMFYFVDRAALFLRLSDNMLFPNTLHSVSG